MIISVALDKPYETIRFLIRSLSDPVTPKVKRESISSESQAMEVATSTDTFNLVTGNKGENLLNLIPIDVREALLSDSLVAEGSDDIGRLCYLMGRSLAVVGSIASTDYTKSPDSIDGISEFLFGAQLLSTELAKHEERIYSFSNSDRLNCVTVDIQRTPLLLTKAIGVLSKNRMFTDGLEETDILEILFFSMFFISVGYLLTRGKDYKGGTSDFIADSLDEAKREDVLAYLATDAMEHPDKSDGRFFLIAIALSAINQYIYHFSGYAIADNYTKAISSLAYSVLMTDREMGGIPMAMKTDGFLDLVVDREFYDLDHILSGSQKILFNQNPVQVVRFINRFDIPDDFTAQNPFRAVFDIDAWVAKEKSKEDGSANSQKIGYLDGILSFLKDLSFTGIGNIADSYQIYRLATISATLWSMRMDPEYKDWADEIKNKIATAFYLTDAYIYALYTRWFFSGNIYKIAYSRRGLNESGAQDVYLYTKTEVDYTLFLLIQFVERLNFNAKGDGDLHAFNKRQRAALAAFDTYGFMSRELGPFVSNYLSSLLVDPAVTDITIISDTFVQKWKDLEVPLVLSSLGFSKDLMADFAARNTMGLSSQIDHEKIIKIIGAEPKTKITGRQVSDRFLEKILKCYEEFDAHYFAILYSAFILSPIVDDLDSVSVSERIPSDKFKNQNISFSADRFNSYQDGIRKTIQAIIF